MSWEEEVDHAVEVLIEVVQEEMARVVDPVETRRVILDRLHEAGWTDPISFSLLEQAFNEECERMLEENHELRGRAEVAELELQMKLPSGGEAY